MTSRQAEAFEWLTARYGSKPVVTEPDDSWDDPEVGDEPEEGSVVMTVYLGGESLMEWLITESAHLEEVRPTASLKDVEKYVRDLFPAAR